MELECRAADAMPPPVSTVPGVFSDQPLPYASGLLSVSFSASGAVCATTDGCSSDGGAAPASAAEIDLLCARPYLDLAEIKRENEIRKDLLALRRRMQEARLKRRMMFGRKMALRGLGSGHNLAYDDVTSVKFLDQGYPVMARHFDVPRNYPPDPNPLLQNKPKPVPNPFGINKRKAEPESATLGNTESPVAHPAKKPKGRWVCALCEVSATSERGLNDHLQGKKHWLKEAEVRDEKIKISLAVDVDDEAEAGLADDDENVGSTGPSGIVCLKKAKGMATIMRSAQSRGSNLTVAGPAVNTASRKRRFKHWCGMCRVGTDSAVVYASHENGKKHLAGQLELGGGVHQH